MSMDIVGKAPFWLVKFIGNKVARRKMVRYNTVVLPEDQAKWEKLGPIKSQRIKKASIDFILDKGTLRISSLDNGVIHLQCSRDLNEIPETNAVILQNRNPPPFIVEKEEEKIIFQQESTPTVFLNGEVDKEKGTILFKDGFNFGIFTEELPSFHEEGWYKTEKKPEVGCENHYGFGEKGGPLDKKGETISFWNTDSFSYDTDDSKLYQTQPIQIIVRPNGFCYAIVYDNPYKSQIIIGEDGDCSSEYYVAGGGINYYLIIGPSIRKVLGKLANLLGNAPIPPISALGHHQSRWSYGTEEEVRELVKEFRTREIPCDYVHLDIDYMIDYRIFTWDKEKFPNISKLSKELLEEGFRLMAITDPGVKVDPKYKIYKEGIKGNHFCLNPDGTIFTDLVWPDDCHFPDFTQFKTREWFGSHFKALTDVGISGFWIDMNEPSVFNEMGTIGDDIIHPAEGANKLHKEIHNQYGHLMAQATYEGLQKLIPDKRIYVNSRSAYLGTHRYSGTWTGDNLSEWSHLQISIPMLLNMAVSGQVMIGPDIGGFGGTPSSELLIRWYQAGILYPYFRNHTISKKHSQEPWVFGKKTENLIRNIIQLRYSLIVYIYNVIRESCLTGIPAFRALWVDYPKDPMSHMAEWAETQYLFGDHLLVTPILKRGRRKRDIYLPSGRWYSFCGQFILDGNKIHEISVPLEVTPIFVKGGSIIPVVEDKIQHTGEIVKSKISLRIYPKDSEAKGEIYLDDGETHNYKDGEYEHVKIEAEKKAKDTWYINITREGKRKEFIEIGEVTILGEEKSNYLVFEK